jgi:ABC-type branched-subunit amino acid transport system ATPase component
VLLAMDEPAAGLNPSGVDALDDLITRIRSQGVVVLLGSGLIKSTIREQR